MYIFFAHHFRKNKISTIAWYNYKVVVQKNNFVIRKILSSQIELMTLTTSLLQSVAGFDLWIVTTSISTTVTKKWSHKKDESYIPSPSSKTTNSNNEQICILYILKYMWIKAFFGRTKTYTYCLINI